MRWEDEMKVSNAEELLSFMVCGSSFSLQEINHVFEDCMERRWRLSVGNLFGSESVHFHSLETMIGGADKLIKHLHNNEEREQNGHKKKRYDPSKLPGFSFREPREEKTDE